MKNGLWLALIVSAIAVNVCGYQVDFEVRNINGQSPLANVIITVTGNESQTVNDTVTDSDGLATIGMTEALTYYTMEYRKAGFHTLTENNTLNLINDTLSVYMFPISQDGIIRLRLKDLMFKDDRRYCVFYKANDRMQGCYKENETIQLVVNTEYYMSPIVRETDMFSSSQNILYNNSLLSGTFPLFIVFILMLGVMIRIIWKKR